MKGNTIKKVIINILELIILVLLIAIIIYLIKSENGIVGAMNKKTAPEKLSKAINSFVASTEDKELEEFIKEIDGLEEIDADEDSGFMHLKITGQEFLVGISTNSQEEMGENAHEVENGIYIEEITENKNEDQNKQENQ